MLSEQDWASSKLTDYLLYAFWTPTNAMRVMAGLDYHWPPNERTEEHALCNAWLHSSTEGDPAIMGINKGYFQKLGVLQDAFSRLQAFWHAERLDDRPRAPQDFIAWALSKNIRPAWLDWAIEQKLYSPQLETEKNTQPDADSSYSTAWLAVQKAAIAQFFSPRRNPDAKKEEVVEWIKQQAEKAGLPDSNNIASTIFTIIKPPNHDPKKRRG